MKRRILGLLVLPLLIVVLGASNSDLSVTSMISDYNSSGIAYYVQSDGQYGGAYYNGQAGVQSILQSTAGYSWELSTYNASWTGSSGRNALITLGPANQQSASAMLPRIWSSWGTHVEPVRFIEKCFYFGVNMLAIKPGSPQACPIELRFGPNFGSGKNTAYYRLDMVGPNLCKQCVNESETQEVQVSCNAQDVSGNCNDWSIDSIPPTSQNGGVPTNQVVARLNLVGTNSGPVDEGDFYLTFHIHVTNP